MKKFISIFIFCLCCATLVIAQGTIVKKTKTANSKTTTTIKKTTSPKPSSKKNYLPANKSKKANGKTAVSNNSNEKIKNKFQNTTKENYKVDDLSRDRAKPKSETTEYDLYNEVDGSWDMEKYESFLKKFPEGEYSYDIELQKNELELWQKALKDNSITSYQSYINNTSYGHFRDNAEANIMRLKDEAHKEFLNAWENTKKLNSIEAYNSFMNRYPNSEYYGEAKKLRDELEANKEWNKILNLYSIDKYQILISKYPNFSKRSQVESFLNAEKGKKEYENQNMNKAYMYFKNVSNSDVLNLDRYSQAYNKSKEIALFNELSESSKPSELKKYLKEYPSSPYTSQIYGYLGISLANNFNIYSTKDDYREALSFAQNKDQKKLINEKKKENERAKKSFKKNASSHSKSSTSKSSSKNDGDKSLKHYNFPATRENSYSNSDNSTFDKEKLRGKLRLGIEYIDYAFGQIGNELAPYFGLGLRLRYGAYNDRLQASFGVRGGFESDYVKEDEDLKEDELNIHWLVPIDLQLKLNLFTAHERWVFVNASCIYNAVRNKEFNRPMAWQAGFGVAGEHFDWSLYYRREFGKYKGSILECSNKPNFYIGTTFSYYFKLY